MPKEIFKYIPGYEGIFQVSNMGTLKRLSVEKKNHSKINILPERISKGLVGKNGYIRTSLRGKKYIMSRLVASAFLGLDLSDSKTFVCHKDDNPNNNRLENLFIGTCKDNHDDMKKKGRMAVNEMLPQTKLNSDMIQFIRDSKGKISQTILAKMFNVGQPHISKIISNNRRNYA